MTSQTFRHWGYIVMLFAEANEYIFDLIPGPGRLAGDVSGIPEMEVSAVLSMGYRIAGRRVVILMAGLKTLSIFDITYGRSMRHFSPPKD